MFAKQALRQFPIIGQKTVLFHLGMNPIHSVSVLDTVAIFSILHYLARPDLAVYVNLPIDYIHVFCRSNGVQLAQS